MAREVTVLSYSELGDEFVKLAVDFQSLADEIVKGSAAEFTVVASEISARATGLFGNSWRAFAGEAGDALGEPGPPQIPSRSQVVASLSAMETGGFASVSNAARREEQIDSYAVFPWNYHGMESILENHMEGAEESIFMASINRAGL